MTVKQGLQSRQTSRGSLGSFGFLYFQERRAAQSGSMDFNKPRELPPTQSPLSCSD